jgi:hypothetical protein
MKPLFRSWILLLVGAICVVGAMTWMRLNPAEPDDPLLQARRSIAEGFGMDLAIQSDGSGGLRVEAVTPGRPAEQVGIEVGDRIVACGDRSVWHVHQMAQFVNDQLVLSGTVTLLVEREGRYWAVVFGRQGAVPRGAHGQR